jgi:two-component system, cell cycle sensor histidine kinase and response regulator CckA
MPDPVTPGSPGAPAAEVLQVLVEHSSDVILLLTEEGRIRYASQSNERVLGFRDEALIGRSGFPVIHPEDEARVRRLFNEALANPGRPLLIGFRAKHRDGSWRDIEAIAVNRLGNPAIQGIVVNYRDVTERVRAEQALRDAEGRYRHLIEHASDIIYRCDAEGRFAFVNPTAARVMQFEESELIGRHFLDLIRPDFRGAAEAFYRGQLRNRTATTYFEFPAVAKDGSDVWFGQNVHLVMEGDTIVGVEAIARDITARRRAEDALRRSEERYRSLVHGALYGIYRVTLDGRFLEVNPALAEMLGYESPEQLMNSRNVVELYQRPERRAELIAEYRDGPFEGVEVDWRRKDGAPITVRLTGRIVDDEGDEPHIEAIVENVTERRVLEEQLRQSQKMEAIGQLARGVAHDFNNLLATMMGSSELLLTQLGPDDPRRIEAEEILKAADRGAALTRQLLAFSRRQATDPKVLDLAAVVRQMDSMLQRLIRSEISLEIMRAVAPVYIRADMGHVEQILMNLVINARDAMPAGGQLIVDVTAVEVDDKAALVRSGMRPGKYARLSVGDTGVGIDADAQSRIFEPFYSTKEPGKGTGLGLSIVYGIVKQSGGTISVSSEIGYGTTIKIYLPLVAAPATGATAPTA